MASFGMHFNTLRPRQNGRHFADDTFNRIFVNENVRISIKFPLTFVPKGPINNIPALVQIMAWRRPGDKSLSEPVMLVYWRIYASLGLNELIKFQSQYKIFYAINWIENYFIEGQWVNLLQPSDTTWWHRSGSTLAQVMACCVMVPSHHWIQCWLLISSLCGIHLIAISHQEPKLLFCIMRLKSILLKLMPFSQVQWVKSPKWRPNNFLNFVSVTYFWSLLTAMEWY